MKRTSLTLLTLLILTSGTALAERLAVTADIANIRSGPGTGHDVIWQVQKYFPFDVIKKEGAWYQFRDFEGDIGWIHESLVGNLSTVITRSPECNVRAGPGIRHDILFTVSGGIPFKVLAREGTWLQIQHADGDRGWIHDSLVW